MFSKLFYKRSIGFRLQGDSIKYALITSHNNKLIVNETQIFKLNCKTALHKLQSLLTKFPSVSVIDSSGILLKGGPSDIKKTNDRKQIVKNKIESLVEDTQVSLNFQSGLKKKYAPLFAIHNKLLSEHQEVLEKNGIKPQKTLCSVEALLSLEHHLFPFDSKRALFYFTEENLELLFVTHKNLSFFRSLPIQHLDVDSLEKKILRLLYAHFHHLDQVELHFHGSSPILQYISSRLQNETGLQVKEKTYSELEKEAPNFLIEVGAALSLIKRGPGGFQKARLSSLIKVYKKALIANTTLLLSLFIISYFYWGHKYSLIKNENLALFHKSYSKLCKKEDLVATNAREQIFELNNLLKKKKREEPTYLFQPNTFSVSDTLAWLSDISERLKTHESKSSFVIESFKYSLISRPTEVKSSTPYSVKVSFSFSTDSSLTARMVHDTISQSTEVIDTGKKIDWNYQNNRYQISFYLKNNILKKVGHG